MSSATREYEAVLIVSSDLTQQRVDQLQSQWQEWVAQHGGKVLEFRNDGKRRLRYPIKRRADGIILQVRWSMDPKEVANLEKTARLIEPLLRLMIVQARGGLVSVNAGEEHNGGSE